MNKVSLIVYLGKELGSTKQIFSKFSGVPYVAIQGEKPIIPPKGLSLMENYFKGSRICKYCGINMDIKDLDMLYFFHDTCWQEYRKNGEVYPMPKHEG